MPKWSKFLILMVFLFPGCSDEDENPVSPPSITTGELILIEAGSYMMGSSEDDMGHVGDEGLHSVTLTNDFHMLSIEVTNQLYADLAQWALDLGYCTVVGTRVYDNLDGSTLELLDMDDGELTKTGKIRRKFVREKYNDLYEALYDETVSEKKVEAFYQYQDGQTTTVDTTIRFYTMEED